MARKDWTIILFEYYNKKSVHLVSRCRTKALLKYSYFILMIGTEYIPNILQTSEDHTVENVSLSVSYIKLNRRISSVWTPLFSNTFNEPSIQKAL